MKLENPAVFSISPCIAILKIAFFLQVSFFPTHADAQNEVSGHILGPDSLPVAYASVYSKSQKAGCYADSTGYFSIVLPDNLNTLSIHALGYLGKDIQVPPSPKNMIVYLEPKQILLNEVLIRPDKFQSSPVWMVTAKKSKGDLKSCSNYSYQCGVYFPNTEHISGELGKVRFLLENEYLKEALFRIRVYQVDEQKPDKDLLLDNVVVRMPRSNKSIWVEKDLSNFRISIPENGLVVALEWIKLPENKYIYSYDYNRQQLEKQCFGPVLKLGPCDPRFFTMWSKRDDSAWFKNTFQTNVMRKTEGAQLAPCMKIEIKRY